MVRDKNEISRSAGILLPVSSLPSKYGIGSFGKTARKWIDFLHDAKQSYWQILPLNPTGYGDSPYQSFSAYAGNPYFIDFDELCENGLLTKSDYSGIRWSSSKKRVDYATILIIVKRFYAKHFHVLTIIKLSIILYSKTNGSTISGFIW